MKNLQYKWDVWLIMNFYTHPGKLLKYVTLDFMRKNNIETFDEFNERVPLRRSNYKNHSNSQVSAFVGCYLPRIAKVLWEKDIEDVFDIAEKLRESPIDTNKLAPKLEEATEFAKEKMHYRRIVKILDAVEENKDKSNRSNWMATKQRGK